MKNLRRLLALLLIATTMSLCLGGCASVETAKTTVIDSTKITFDTLLGKVFAAKEKMEEEKTLEPMPTVAFMPLDSRPCNTQYPTLLLKAAGATLLTPPASSLDSLSKSADTNALWTWLWEEGLKADHVVIFTNTLFCGGLVASRSGGSYDNIIENLNKLEEFCTYYKAENPGSTVTVVQVLPRLVANQFDEDLYPYMEQLTAYGKSWDESAKNDQPIPDAIEGVPAEVLQKYRAIHEKAFDCATSLNQFAETDLIDELIISQDDGDTLCPANITFRALEDTKDEHTTLIHGADELGMIILANLIAGKEKTPVNVVYSSKSAAKPVYPYESVTLKENVAEKLALAGLKATDEDSHYTLYIHADTADLDNTTDFIANTTNYLGIADVALTNKQDPALEEWLFDSTYYDNIDAYAAWNTAGNSIGTVCAVMRIASIIDDRFKLLSDEERLTACQSLYSFRAIRYSEDCIYMSNIRNDLTKKLEEEGLMEYTTVFTSDENWSTATTKLNEAYGPYNTKLAGIFNGDHTLCFGQNTIAINVTDYTTTASFPWPRAFEILVQPQMNVSLLEEE